MTRKEILKLIAGFRRFREKYYLGESNLYQKLSGGQSPKTLIIACSDSRVDPAIISSASPGELFVVRNVANLVPPYEVGGGLHGVSAAIEFAVAGLKVENVVIMGHRQCGGIRSLMLNETSQNFTFVSQWMKIAEPAKKRVLTKFPDDDQESLCRHGEMESIITSLENLRTFPFVKEAIQERNLNLLGVYFDLEQGLLLEYDEESQVYKTIEIDRVQST